MKNIAELYKQKERPVRVLQIGEGNFLRAFADYMIDITNSVSGFNGNVVIAKPISQGSLDRFKRQNNLYTVSLRGRKKGKPYIENRVIDSIAYCVDTYSQFREFLAVAEIATLKFVISNTTEAGISYVASDRPEMTPPSSYPAKLTVFLYHRYQAFSGAADKGLIILPVELIDDNGDQLKKIVLQYVRDWELPAGFKNWLEDSCYFCSTLVDRIVTGYPKADPGKLFSELGYQDELLDTAEPYGLWVIKCPQRIAEQIPFDKAGLPVIYTDDLTPYHERKVRILNGAHTSTVLAGYLIGKNIVRECMHDPLISEYMKRTVRQEIIPTIKLPEEEKKQFADDVFERFDNPYVDHSLLAISLNSVSKWKARILPSFKDEVKLTGRCPELLSFSFAALLAFYHSGELRDNALISQRGKDEYAVHDDMQVLEYFAAHSKDSLAEYVHSIASRKEFWGEDLTQYPGFEGKVVSYLQTAEAGGMAEAMKAALADVK